MTLNEGLRRPARQPLARSGLRVIVADHPDLELVGEAASGAEAVQLVTDAGLDVVVMDVRMPGMDGIEATRRITAGPTATHVPVLTTFDYDAHVYGALRAGASGFMVKDLTPDDILAAIRAVATGDAPTAPSVTRRLIADFISAPPLPRNAPHGRSTGSPSGNGKR